MFRQMLHIVGCPFLYEFFPLIGFVYGVLLQFADHHPEVLCGGWRGFELCGHCCRLKSWIRFIFIMSIKRICYFITVFNIIIFPFHVFFYSGLFSVKC